MNEILRKLTQCVEVGKIDKACPYPPSMKGQDGIDEIAVIDLGVDVGEDKFIRALEKNPEASIGLSALLTTTMENMRKIVFALKQKHPGTKILMGGAPVTQEYCNKIGADFYSPDPQETVNYLKTLFS